MHRSVHLGAVTLLISLASGAHAGSQAVDAGEVVRAGCQIRTQQIDARGIATVAAECHWPLPPEAVTDLLRDPDQLRAALSSLAEAKRLPDGRVLQVHTVGWPLDDRQVTLDWRESALPGGGTRFDYAPAEHQEPLGQGRVAIAADDGYWAVRPAGAGGTLLSYTSRYDAGGALKPWIVRRFQKEGIATSLQELRAAALARVMRRAETGPSGG